MDLEYRDITVANDASLSDAISTMINGVQREVLTLTTPAELTGTTLTVKGSTSVNGTFTKRKVNGDEISLTIASGETGQINPTLVGAAFQFDTGANEAAARTLTVGLRVVQ